MHHALAVAGKNIKNAVYFEMKQNQLAKLFDASVPNISMHISNILKELGASLYPEFPSGYPGPYITLW